MSTKTEQSSPISSASSDDEKTRHFEAPNMPVTDLDLAFLKASIKGRLGSASAISGPRHTLNEDQNELLRQSSQKLLKHLDEWIDSVSTMKSGDRPLKEDFHLLALHRIESSISKISNESLSGQDMEKVSQAFSRDAIRAKFAIVDMANDCALSSNAHKLSMLDAFERRISNPSDKPYSIGNVNNVERAPEHGLVGSTINFIAAKIKPLVDFLSPKQEDKIFSPDSGHKLVEEKLLKLSERFGLDGVTITSADWFTPRQQMRWIDRVEGAMQESSRRLGIEEDQFGANNKLRLMIHSPEITALTGADGFYQGSTKSNLDRESFTMAINAGSNQMERSLVHEFTHQLDNLLGIKAFRGSPDMVLDVDDDRSIFFSQMSAEQRATLPQANLGLGQVVSNLSDKTFLDRFLIPSSSKSDNSEAANLLQANTFELVQKIVDKLPLDHLGPHGMLQLSKEEHQAYKESFNKHAHALVMYVAGSADKQPIDVSALQYIEDMKKDLGHRKDEKYGDFVDIAGRVIGTPSHKKGQELSVALFASRKDLIELKSLMHPMTQLAAEHGQVRPSSMLKESVKMDINLVDSGKNPYQSQPLEFIARIVDRPHSFKEMIQDKNRPGWNRTLDSQQMKKLNEGMANMLDEAGIKRVSSPDLGSSNEKMAELAIKLADKFKPESKTLRESMGHETFGSFLADRLKGMFLPEGPKKNEPSMSL